MLTKYQFPVFFLIRSEAQCRILLIKVVITNHMIHS